MAIVGVGLLAMQSACAAPLPSVKLDNCIGVVTARKHRDLSVGGRAASEDELAQLLLDEPASASEARRVRALASGGYASLALAAVSASAGFIAGPVGNRPYLGIGLGFGAGILGIAAAATLLLGSQRAESRAMNAYNEHARATRSCHESFERTLKSLE